MRSAGTVQRNRPWVEVKALSWVSEKKLKRYRVTTFCFDSRPLPFEKLAEEGLSDDEKKYWEKQVSKEASRIATQYGPSELERKVSDFAALGRRPFSIAFLYNYYEQQIRDSFVFGAYYPSLTAACTLGERILNKLILDLRHDYKSSSNYKKVYRKKSFDKWPAVIDILCEWGILLSNVEIAFRQLGGLRNDAVHYDEDLDKAGTDRELALQAISHVTTILSEQFSSFGPQPWFIPGIPGASYIKKEAEDWPFVKRFYLPCCTLVGPDHNVEVYKNGRLVIEDPSGYEQREVSDEDFRDMLGS